jgi:hypothetical protein
MLLMPPVSVFEDASINKPPTGRAGSFEPLHRWAVVLSPHVYFPARTVSASFSVRAKKIILPALQTLNGWSSRAVDSIPWMIVLLVFTFTSFLRVIRAVA